nr:MAG TPA: Helix-turn-helix XRE-family like protein [Bacteriophage sp.]
MKTFVTDAAAIKKLMIDRNIKNIKELSEKSGVNRNTLAKVLNGRVQPSADVMEKLVICLDIESQVAGRIFFVRDLRQT